MKLQLYKVISNDGIERYPMHNTINRSRYVLLYRVSILTLEEVKDLKPGNHVYFITNIGTIASAKITSVKTWKTRPGDCRVGLKYGLYEYFTAYYVDGQPTREQLVKLVDEESHE